MTGALFALRRGEGTGTLVLLHGFGFTHRAWLPVIAALPATLPLVAFDLPGHGGSLCCDAGRARQMADAIVASLPAEPVHLAGHSLGGAVAVLVAMAVPQRISSLTLVAPGGFGPRIDHPLLLRHAAARDRAAIVQALEPMFGAMRPIPQPLIEDLVAMRAREGQVAVLLRIGAGLAHNGVQGMFDRARLAELPMPVRIVWGEEDNVLPGAQTDGLPPAFVVDRFEKAGHMLPQERPGEVARLLTAQMR